MLELLGFADAALGKGGHLTAYDEFLLGDLFLDEQARERFLLPVFLHWLCFTWIPGAATLEALEVNTSLSPSMTLAESYFQENGDRLKKPERDCLQAVGRAPLSFYEITGVMPGKGLRCEDLLTGRRLQIMEMRKDLDMLPGEILFMSAISLEGVDIAVSSSPLIFPASSRSEILELRAELEDDGGVVTRDTLAAHDEDVRDLFLALLAEELGLNESGPDAFGEDWALTEDGLLFEPRTLHYFITDPAEAFEALCSLCAVAREALLEEAEFDAQGKLSLVEFSWDAEEADDCADASGDDDTDDFPEVPVYGFIRIEADTMTIDLDCEAREEDIRKLIADTLGDKARYERTEIQILEYDDDNDYDADFDEDVDVVKF